MAPTLIQIPTLNDAPRDFSRLFEIWSETNGYFADIRFDLSRCDFLRPNAIAFLGGLARLIESRMGSVTFDWTTLRRSWVKTTLQQNVFAYAFGDTTAPWDGSSIPYREDQMRNVTGIMDYLTKNGEHFENRELAFEGTVVHITLHCDENLYRFRDEAE